MASLKDDPRFGLDSRHSWVVAAFSSWFLFMFVIVQRVFSVIYVGILSTFGVTRQEASWPMNIMDLFTSITTPIFGYLCARFSCRAVLLCCGLLGPLGVILCFFAPNVAFITVFYGAMNGAGISGTMMALTVVLAQHFEKRRATAYSIVFTISGFNTFIFPPLIELCMSTYGLYGTFLMLGGICLNSFPAAIGIVSPPWSKPTKHKVNKRVADTEANRSTHEEIQLAPHSDRGGTSQSNGRSEDPQGADTDTQDNPGDVIEPLMTHPEIRNKQNAPPTNVSKIEVLRNVMKVFLTARFWVDSVSFAVMYLALALFLTLTVDLAKDRGIATTEAVFLLHAFSVGDVVFRAVSGVMLDSKLLTVDGVMLLGFFLQVIGIEVLATAATYPLLMLGSLILGCGNGLRMPMAGVVLIADFGVKALPVVFGGFALVCGLNIWIRAPLIGYFRDTHGAYDGVLHVVGAFSFACALVWMVRLFLKRRKTKQLARNSNVQ